MWVAKITMLKGRVEVAPACRTGVGDGCFAVSYVVPLVLLLCVCARRSCLCTSMFCSILGVLTNGNARAR